MPVAKPVLHADPARIMDAMRAQPNVAKPTPAGPTLDPLRTFERDTLYMPADLQQWMTFDEVTRLKLVETFAQPPDNFNRQRNPHRDLNFIIWRETTRNEDGKVIGSKEIAATALRRLFGLEDPKKK